MLGIPRTPPRSLIGFDVASGGDDRFIQGIRYFDPEVQTDFVARVPVCAPSDYVVVAQINFPTSSTAVPNFNTGEHGMDSLISVRNSNGSSSPTYYSYRIWGGYRKNIKPQYLKGAFKAVAIAVRGKIVAKQFTGASSGVKTLPPNGWTDPYSNVGVPSDMSQPTRPLCFLMYDFGRLGPPLEYSDGLKFQNVPAFMRRDNSDMQIASRNRKVPLVAGADAVVSMRAVTGVADLAALLFR